MFYSGEKILNLLDINKEKPEIYMITDLRSTGKTTYFLRMLTNRFIKRGEKFVYLVRFKNELAGLADSLYKDVGSLFFKSKTFTSSIKGDGLYAELFINGEPFGYGLALNSYDKIKKKSHLFVDASSILFDEFQSESSRYVTNEVEAFHSIHQSLSRGGGEQVKYLPVYMLSNHITLLNPYFNSFGLTNLHRDTRFYRGDGFVLEQQFNLEIAKKRLKSGFERAFKKTDYSQMSTQGKYMLDDDKFIEKNHKLIGRYLMTLIYKDCEFGVYDEGYKYHVSDSSDITYPVRYIIGTGYGENVSLLSGSPVTVRKMRNSFVNGNISFSSLNGKECLMKSISY